MPSPAMCYSWLVTREYQCVEAFPDVPKKTKLENESVGVNEVPMPEKIVEMPKPKIKQNNSTDTKKAISPATIYR